MELLATLGQIAAIILLIELFVAILISLALHLAIALGLGWLEEKVYLIRTLQPILNQVNTTANSALQKVSSLEYSNQVVHTVTQVPAYMNTVEEKVEQGSSMVVKAVIEIRARAAMVQGIAQAFLSPSSNNGAAKSTAREKSRASID